MRIGGDDVARYLSCSLALFVGIGVTMATTVGRCFDRSAAMRSIPDHTKQQINPQEDSSSGLLGTGHFDVASEVITQWHDHSFLSLNLSVSLAVRF